MGKVIVVAGRYYSLHAVDHLDYWLDHVSWFDKSRLHNSTLTIGVAPGAWFWRWTCSRIFPSSCQLCHHTYGKGELAQTFSIVPCHLWYCVSTYEPIVFRLNEPLKHTISVSVYQRKYSKSSIRKHYRYLDPLLPTAEDPFPASRVVRVSLVVMILLRRPSTV